MIGRISTALSGHAYFEISDEHTNARINCVMWAHDEDGGVAPRAAPPPSFMSLPEEKFRFATASRVGRVPVIKEAMDTPDSRPAPKGRVSAPLFVNPADLRAVDVQASPNAAHAGGVPITCACI